MSAPSSLLLRTLVIACLGLGPVVANAAGARQLCRFPDGERRVVYQELGATFGLAVSDCKPLPPAPVLADSVPPPEPQRAWRDVDIRVGITTIEAPGARWATLGSSFARPPAMTPAEYQPLIARSARNHNVDPSIVEAVMYVESRFQPNARSDKGALGLMQLMPQTARQYGVQSAGLYDPATNIECGTRYLAELTSYFAGRVDLALAAYNAGPGAVVRHGWRIPPFAETQDYVERVLQRLKSAR